MEAGMDAYLTKTIALKRLARAIDRWCATDAVGLADDEPVLDPERASELRALPGSRGSLLDDAAAMFREQAPAVVEAIAELAASERWKAVAERAHALKGMSATVGAVRLAEIADAIELATKVTSPNPAEVTALLPTLTHTYERTAHALLTP